jgi:hypothetical protein
MITASPSAVMAVLALALSLVFVLVRRKNWIKHIPGPPSPSWIHGILFISHEITLNERNGR